MCSLQEVSDHKKTIELQDCEITIGRGPFLGVTDKRVSRHHGVLKKVENGIKLKSIHINPCFYTKNCEEKWLKLDKNESVILYPGDTFSLLPKQYIYKVIGQKVTAVSKSDSEGQEIVFKNEGNAKTEQDLLENVESKAIVTKVPSNTDSEPSSSTKKSLSTDDDTPKHLSGTNDSNFNDHDSAKFEIQEKATTMKLPANNDSASEKLTAAQKKTEHFDSKCVKIHPNSSKTPKKDNPKSFTKISPTKTPTYVKRKSANTYMDGDKEVALLSKTKRKLPSWMKAKKNDTAPTNSSTSTKHNDKPPKKVEKTKKITPKRPVAKKRRKVQNIDFDSDETPDELENEPQGGSDDDEEMAADVKTPDKDEVTAKSETEAKDGMIKAIVKDDDEVTKEVENDDDVTSKVTGRADATDDLKKHGDITTRSATGNRNGNDIAIEDVDMVDASVAAKSMDFDDGVAPSSDDDRSMLPSNPDAVATSRNSCPYGASCYRKNPAHFVEFSHPGDNDYQDQKSDEESEKPECPYGTSCYRKNPVHQREYKHTKRVAPKRRTKTKAARKKDGDESSPDDYDLDDSFLNDDDEEEEDEDISDGDSDWNPSNSQSQKATRKSKRARKRKSYHESDSEDETTDEDLDDLVSDAKKFATNRKMWK